MGSKYEKEKANKSRGKRETGKEGGGGRGRREEGGKDLRRLEAVHIYV